MPLAEAILIIPSRSDLGINPPVGLFGLLNNAQTFHSVLSVWHLLNND